MATAPSGSTPNDAARTPSTTPPDPLPTFPPPASPPSHDSLPTTPSDESKSPKSNTLPSPPANVAQVDSPPASMSSSGGSKLSGSSSIALAPEVGKADVQISADGSFVQTSSALAARELKKAYDQILREKLGTQGVIRSPYAITAVPDASGNTVFRIGYREPTVDPNKAEASSEPSSTHSPGHAGGSRRKARLSVHDFLPSSIFKPIGSGTTPPRSASSFSLGSASISQPSGTNSPLYHSPRNKLRKQRSNSDLHLRGTSSPPHGTSSAGDSAPPMSPSAHSENFAIEIRDEITAGADAFGQILAWSSEIVSDTITPSRKSSKASSVPPVDENQNNLAPATNTSLSRRPSVSTSAALSATVGAMGSAPFGENVQYTAPTRRSAIFLAPKAPQLREVQSFESGLTARAGDEKEDASPATPKSKSPLAKRSEDDAFQAAKSQARFSTSVFDVLQTYRGLPLPSTLSELPTGATIKLSTTDSANPKDDPRFVIWGEIQPEPLVDDSSVSHSQTSHTDLSASVSPPPGSRKRSNARPPQTNNEVTSVMISSELMPKTIMIAATVERWIAQLTSELNYEELLNFLLTYRTYIAPVDLCHLLICRFHWALETPTSRQDDMVRRIVRVRTFIAIRYWLLTFFREDFLPNVELCQLFASWLNALFRDPALEKHADAVSIVRKLKKIVRECKAAHSRGGRSGLGRPPIDMPSVPYTSLNGILGDIGGRAAIDVPKKDGDERAGEEIDDSDVDLDFSQNVNVAYTDLGVEEATSDSLHESVAPSNVPAQKRPSASISSVQGRASATPSANSILLSQPLSQTILGHVKSTTPGTDAPLTQLPLPLPAQHSAISRAFVNTIGRLGRWKRVLNSRSSVPAPHCADVSAFDLELNATGDLLSVRGGVEKYLKMLNLSTPLLVPPQVDKSDETEPPVLPPGLGPTVEDEINAAKSELPSSSSLQLEVLAEENEGSDQENAKQVQEGNSRISVISASTSADTHSQATPPPEWEPDVISLDDYDLSDSGSSAHSGPKVRRLPRRLPLRRDFQFVRRSVDTVSSMGIRSHSSFASSILSGRSASRSVRSISRESNVSEGPLITGIQSWQIELIDSDDEGEAGDAEAALRRLEGQIDADRQREKDLKVGRWLRTAYQRERDSARNSIQSDSMASGSDHDEGRSVQERNEEARQSVSSKAPSVAERKSVADASELPVVDSMRTIKGDPAVMIAAVSTNATVRDRSGSVDSTQKPQTSRPTSRRPSILRGPSSKFASPNVPTSHRSFIMMHRSETLARQFAIIEAELFTKIKFEELISHQWGQSTQDANVRDWVQFVKEKARLKNSASTTQDRAVRIKLSAILALRARFNLLVNFVASEIVLTHSNERVMVVEKFIRIAWKAYLHNNFSTLVALIAGLQTRWVNQALSRQWQKVGMWEQRLFDDLRRFTSRGGKFKYIRNATAALVDAGPLDPALPERGSMTKSGTSVSSKSKGTETRGPPACVPFLGMYLTQLYDHEKLPDFVDPTAPSEPVLIDPETGNLSSPAHPDVFFNLQPLPSDLDLEPLINVHKQRLIADVIKSFVAGQHLATNIHFDVDQKAWQKCFRLRSLEPEALHSITKSLSDS